MIYHFNSHKQSLLAKFNVEIRGWWGQPRKNDNNNNNKKAIAFNHRNSCYAILMHLQFFYFNP